MKKLTPGHSGSKGQVRSDPEPSAFFPPTVEARNSLGLYSFAASPNKHSQQASVGN